MGNRCHPLVPKRTVLAEAGGLVQRIRLLQPGLLHPSVPKVATGHEDDRRRCHSHGIKAKGLTHQFVSLTATELRLNARKVA